MNFNSMLECESKSLEKLKKYQLPYSFKLIGLGILAVFFIAVFVIANTSNNETYKLISKYGMLIGLLIISISKEKIEDELVRDLRMQSYSFAFIVAVLYTLAMPIVEYFVDIVAQNQDAGIKDLGDFTILWLLMCSQIGYFAMLKKIHR